MEREEGDGAVRLASHPAASRRGRGTGEVQKGGARGGMIGIKVSTLFWFASKQGEKRERGGG